MKLFVDMESEQESMTMRTIRSNSGGQAATGPSMAPVGLGRSPGYASMSSANR